MMGFLFCGVRLCLWFSLCVRAVQCASLQRAAGCHARRVLGAIKEGAFAWERYDRHGHALMGF